MSKNRYYYYDQESCSFIEVKPGRKQTLGQIAAMVVAALGMAWVLAWGLDRTIGTPQELALQAENEALQEQLSKAGSRMEDFQSRLKKLAAFDQRIYRTLLEAKPISENVRQAGVGGSDPYKDFNRFSENTSSLLRETSQQIDQLQRRIDIQNTSFRHLSGLADKRDQWLAQMPVLLPTDGAVVSGFGRRMHPILGVMKMHTGVDQVVEVGTPVVATGDGIVERATFGPGYGNFIEIRHPSTKYTTLYGHLSEIPDKIRKGVEVKRGEVIGLSGNSGRSTGPHVHYEVRKQDHPLNPIYFFMPSMTPDKYKKLVRQAEESKTSLD